MERSGFMLVIMFWVVVIGCLVASAIYDNKQKDTYARACSANGGVAVFRIAAQPLCVPQGTLINVK